MFLTVTSTSNKHSRTTTDGLMVAYTALACSASRDKNACGDWALLLKKRNWDYLARTATPTWRSDTKIVWRWSKKRRKRLLRIVRNYHSRSLQLYRWGAENATSENAGLQKARLNCMDGKYRTKNTSQSCILKPWHVIFYSFTLCPAF